MKKATLCLLIRNDEILLGMKKRGFGEGKWNGVGGKVEAKESVEDAAIREMEEEISVTCNKEDLENMGNIKFYFSDNPDWNLHVHIFTVSKWVGEPQESDEISPKWYKQSDIPYDSMWADDTHWLPKVLAGKQISGEFYFRDQTIFDSFNLKEKEKN